MKAADVKFNPIDSYLALLHNLSPEGKRELISRLSESLIRSGKATTKSLNELYGAFISTKPADEIIAELKSSRKFNRKTEQL
ncbi:MAG: hypothetical protein MUC38_08340 [Cyclobacteriaceae bacterium]|jgi:hypothetical protein|nr:hypothetical protein [Cyclobacteriaceae bacterium]